MLHINPINYRDNNYSIVRKKDKKERWIKENEITD